MERRQDCGHGEAPTPFVQWLTQSWHDLVPAPWATVVLILVAVLCGAIVGIERTRKEKPVGFRTLTLVSLGAAIFTMMSITLGGKTRQSFHDGRANRKRDNGDEGKNEEAEGETRSSITCADHNPRRSHHPDCGRTGKAADPEATAQNHARGSNCAVARHSR
jgi:hypothetical protein